MRKENRIENRNEKIESQLFQIKILLLILIALCLLGFYGLSTIMDVMGKIFNVLFWLFILNPFAVNLLYMLSGEVFILRHG